MNDGENQNAIRTYTEGKCHINICYELVHSFKAFSSDKKFKVNISGNNIALLFRDTIIRIVRERKCCIMRNNYGTYCFYMIMCRLCLRDSIDIYTSTCKWCILYGNVLSKDLTSYLPNALFTSIITMSKMLRATKTK